MTEVEALMEIATAIKAVVWAMLSFIFMVLGIWLGWRRRS